MDHLLKLPEEKEVKLDKKFEDSKNTFVYEKGEDFWDYMDKLNEKETKWDIFVDNLYKIKWWIKGKWERFYCRIKFGYKPHIIKTGLPPAYFYGIDHRMLYGMMSLLVEFIEKEKPFEIVEWESDPEHSNAAKEFTAIYEWWKKYPDLLKKEEAASHNWYEYHKKRKLPEFDEKEEMRLLDLSRQVEVDRYNQEQDMLTRLVKIRLFLWT